MSAGDNSGVPLVNAAVAGPQTAAAAEIQELSKCAELVADLEEMKAVALREDDRALLQLHEHLSLAVAPVQWPQQHHHKQQDGDEKEAALTTKVKIQGETEKSSAAAANSDSTGTLFLSRKKWQQEQRLSFRRLLRRVSAAAPFIRYNRVLLLECCIDPWWLLWQQRRLRGIVAVHLLQVKCIARRLQKSGVNPRVLLEEGAFEKFRLLEGLPRSAFVQNYLLRHHTVLRSCHKDTSASVSMPQLPSCTAAGSPLASLASSSIDVAEKKLPSKPEELAATIETPVAAAKITTATATVSPSHGVRRATDAEATTRGLPEAEETSTGDELERAKVEKSSETERGIKQEDTRLIQERQDDSFLCQTQPNRHDLQLDALHELQACGVVTGAYGEEVNVESLKEMFGTGDTASERFSKLDPAELRAERERRRSLPKDRIGRQELHQQRMFREAAVGKALPRPADEKGRRIQQRQQQQGLCVEPLSPSAAQKYIRVNHAFDTLFKADFPEYTPLNDIYRLETFVEAEYRLNTIKRDVQQQLRVWIEEGMQDEEPRKTRKHDFLVYWLSLSRRQRKQLLRDESPTGSLSTVERLRRIRSRFIAASDPLCTAGSAGAAVKNGTCLTPSLPGD